MSDTTAAFYAAPRFDGRSVPVAGLRRLVRTAGEGLVHGVGALAAVGVLGTIVTLGAAWIVSSVLVTNPNVQTASMRGPGMLTLALSEPPLVRTADASFEAKWARASTGGAPLLALQITDDTKPVIASTRAPIQVAKLPPVPLPPQRPVEQAANIPLPQARPHIAPLEVAGPPIPPHPIQQLAMATPPVMEKRAALPPAALQAPKAPETDSRTAIYDISARTVFLPNGQKLEAHSGLYDKLDDPRYVHVRMRGPTPPNVYDLTLREQLFHGVRAIRLNPVDEGKMFGRDGILAHTYMLGPNGQSNGCVSFKDYDRFLQAFLRGEVDRLVVVPEGGIKLAAGFGPRRGQGRYASAEPAASHGDRAW